MFWYNKIMSIENKAEYIKYPGFAIEIQKMVDIDQDMRERNLSEGDYWDDTVDKENTERMKEIISEIGWPTVSKVGKDGSDNAWLLVQHADHDPDFQMNCLKLMKESHTNEVDRNNIAYLEDRVRLNQGKGQLYGTQFTQENGRHIPRTIEDVDNVDIRRAEIGMGPLSEQIQKMYNKYPFDEAK